MANATSRLQITIDAKNNSSTALKQTTSDLKNLDNAAGILSGGLAGLAGAAGVGALFELGAAAASAVFDMSRLAATATDIETSFETMARQAGASSEQMFAGLKEASRGTISDMDLMLSANRAMLLGVADSTEEMVALMDVARAASQAMGTTTAEAFSDLVTGLGRGSAQILDNLGIIVDADTANQAYADSIGKTVSQLTDQERKQALVNAVLLESQELVAANAAAGDDAASHFERMDTAIKNAKVALGELFQPAMIAFADAMARAASSAAEGMTELAEAPPTDLGPELGSLVDYLGQVTTKARETNASFAEQAQASRIAQEGVSGLGNAATGTATALEDTAADAATVTYEIRSMTAVMGSAIGQFNALGATASRALSEAALMANLAQEAFANLRAEQEAISNEIDQAAASAGAFIAGKRGGDAGLAKQQAVGDELSAQVESWKDAGYTQQQINDVLLPGMVSQMNEADHAAFKVARGTAKISDEAREAERAFSELESTVAGVLRGALDPGVGVDPDELLEKMGIPRADAINENARRLADIAANGLKGQDWLGEFQKEVPDIWNMIRLAQNPQEEAAYLLRDFQDGLLTSPIDKAKAKEIVRRQIMGDQNMAALATEIANELAMELGVPLSTALAATKGTLGGGGGEEAAMTFSDAAAQGLADAGGGVQFVDTFVEQMKSRYSLLATAGRDAGKAWGESFIAAVGDNVPAPLITLLSELVTPQVFAKFHQQGSLTGSAP